MWNALIVIVMAALTGFYMMPGERSQIAADNHEARVLAESMGLYREAVVSYFSSPGMGGTSVGIDALKESGMLPAWSALYTRSGQSPWTNYRDSAGIIYIFQERPAGPNIVSEVLQLSGNSMNVGIYRASDRSLYSPADGSRVVLTSAAGAPIPDTALVWLASRH